MASPHVAGAVALLWSSNPELIGQIEMTAWLLQQTATPRTTAEGCGGDSPTEVPNNTYGYGRLDVYAASRQREPADSIPNGCPSTRWAAKSCRVNLRRSASISKPYPACTAPTQPPCGSWLMILQQ